MSIYNPEFRRRIKGIEDDDLEDLVDEDLDEDLDDLGLSWEKPADTREEVLRVIEGEDEKIDDESQGS